MYRMDKEMWKETSTGMDAAGRRIAAFLIDLIIVYLLYLLLLFLFRPHPQLYRFHPAFPYPLEYGLLLFLYSLIFDLFMGSTPGKVALSMKLSPPQSGGVVWIFIRELFKANLYLLILDMLFGILLSGGRALRMTDHFFRGGVKEVTPIPEPVPQLPPRPVYRPTPPPVERPREEARVQQATYEGRCPRCGMPYVLTADGREISGLWNGMCIWCGYPVTRHLGV